ncbi:conserved hypothetical protein [Tenacibaculum maritimum]|uniref:hypothetical protein n=1 Tax=Tenacibaculum maritimum TaxID=107401 RepID=UPI0012E40CCB|nr:hypothetical protein [Tenacibaculum maritimum]CAA0186478.1 conserved hypothetical protein [Tenacibaculum maritimum]
MSKYTNNNANFALKNAKSFSEIGQYNQQVRAHLLQNPVDSNILKITIKNFKDSAKRRKVSDLTYNIEVEKFNNAHGLYLLKKGNDTDNNNYYSYLNYPFIGIAEQKHTLINFKKYKEEYNIKIRKENAENCIYNTENVKEESKLTNSEKILKEKFIEDYSHLNTWEYNKKVEFENENLENAIFKKIKLQPLRQAHVNTFRTLLYFYVGQLKLRNSELLNKGRSTRVKKTELPSLLINKRNVKIHKIDGFRELDYSERTIYNHINRLLEAGVFNSYRFYWHKMPTSVQFNREILVISDYNLPKRQGAVKQLFNYEIRKKLPNYTHTTELLSKEIENKNCVKKHSVKKCGSIPANHNGINNQNPAEAYKTHQRICKKIKLEGGEKIKIPSFLKENAEKKSTTLANNFKSRHINNGDFADMLAAKKFDNYKPLPYNYLQRVRLYTTGEISKEEFKEIVIQDFIKTSAKIWKNHTVYASTWCNASKYLKEVLFKNISEKESIENKLKEYRWKLDWARKWFKNNDVNALFPSDYFDTTRKNKNEIGFFSNHLHKKWKESISKNQKSNKNRVLEASKRKKRLRNSKYDNNLKLAIQKYNSGECNYNELSNYVCNNLPKKYISEFLKLTIKTPNND